MFVGFIKHCLHGKIMNEDEYYEFMYVYI